MGHVLVRCVQTYNFVTREISSWRVGVPDPLPDNLCNRLAMARSGAAITRTKRGANNGKIGHGLGFACTCRYRKSPLQTNFLAALGSLTSFSSSLLPFIIVEMSCPCLPTSRKKTLKWA
jgi:hypothetical protein